MINTTPVVNYFELLGVEPGATDDEVRKRYTTLAKEHHPDRGGDAATFAAITDAYHALETADLRRAYEERLRRGSTESEPLDDGAPTWAATTTNLHAESSPAESNAAESITEPHLTGIPGSFDPAQIAAMRVHGRRPNALQIALLGVTALAGGYLLLALTVLPMNIGGVGIFLIATLVVALLQPRWAGWILLAKSFVILEALVCMGFAILVLRFLSDSTKPHTDGDVVEAWLLFGSGIAMLLILFCFWPGVHAILRMFALPSRVYRGALSRGFPAQGSRRYLVSPIGKPRTTGTFTYVRGQIYHPLTFEPVGRDVQFVCDKRVRLMTSNRWLVVDALRGNTGDGEFAMLNRKGQTLRYLRHRTVIEGRSGLEA